MLNRESWKKIEILSRTLGRWIDTRSYRPLILLFVVSMAIFLWPLAVDVAIALFFRIPNGLLKVMGQGLFLALVVAGLRRLWRVRPTDTWPWERDLDVDLPRAFDARWIPWALRITVLSLVLPIMRNPDGLGFADWDFVLDKFEALRRTILIWGQFPWWNPWSRGGFPLAAEPQIGAMSMATPLVLALGTTIGLRIAAILCILIAVDGAYRLARLWLREPWAAAASALIYGLNGAVLIHVSQGYILVMSYCSLPWLFHFAFRIGQRFSSGLWLGFWMAFAVMNGIQYMTLYAVPILAAIWTRALRVQPRAQCRELLDHTVAALGIFLLLCGWRLSTVFLVLLDDKRERVTYWDESPLAAFHYLLARPAPNWPEELPGGFHHVYLDLSCYVGPVVVLLGLASLVLGWRWWHALAILCAWLAMGSVRWYHPSYWLMEWPFFGSAHSVPRWRIVALLGLGLAAGSVLASWRRSDRQALRSLASCLVVIMAADFVVLGYQQLPRAFSIRPAPTYFPGPPVPDIVNVREGLGYPCAMRGYGVIEGYEPMLSYRRDAPTLRRAREDPDYRGEAWTAEGPVSPVSWSPNQMVFQVEPGQELHINQNPSSWWWVNGRQAFPNLRCAEMTIPFVVRANATGRLDLRIHPQGLAAGVGLHCAGAGLLAVAWLFRGRQAQSGYVP
jgi:hypothetical protein